MRSLSRRKELPWLSVEQVREIIADASPFLSETGTRTTKLTKVPSSSSAAIVLNGSPLAKAHGAVALVRTKENHGAS